MKRARSLTGLAVCAFVFLCACLFRPVWKGQTRFIHFSAVPVFLCIAAPCIQPAKNKFAFDVGGVVEYYPSKRLVVRFDAGDLIIKHQRIFGTDQNLQISAGVGVRF